MRKNKFISESLIITHVIIEQMNILVYLLRLYYSNHKKTNHWKSGMNGNQNTKNEWKIWNSQNRKRERKIKNLGLK